MLISDLQQFFFNLEPTDWPVVLNARLIEDNGGDVVPPNDFDALLNSSFVLNDAAGLSVGQGTVGRVVDNTFSITGASLTNGLFGASATSVTLTFTLPQHCVLLVVIDTEMGGGWTFALGFPAMIGDPFTQLTFAQSSMIFSSAVSSTDWPPSSYAPVTLVAGMNFAGTLKLNAYAQSVLAVASLTDTAVPSPLVMSGAFDASGVSDTSVYPVMSLAAPLTAAKFRYMGFCAYGPYFGFDISRMPTSSGTNPDDDNPLQQNVSSYFGASLTAFTNPPLDPPLTLDFTALLFPVGSNLYSLQLSPPIGAHSNLTPANIATISKVSSNFMAIVPPPLQGFFNGISFQGLSVTAVLSAGGSSPTIITTSVSVGTGAMTDNPLILISDPTSGFEVMVDSLDLSWSVSDLGGNFDQAVLFSGVFTVSTAPFNEGSFDLSIDQNYTITAEYNGQLSLAELLPALTNNLVGLPAGVVVTFTDISLMIDPSDEAYSFSFGVDAAVDIISIDNTPLIQFQGMVCSLSASTPQSSDDASAVSSAKTTYNASMSGMVIIDNVGLNVDVVYDGTQWNFSSALVSPLNLSSLLIQLYNVTDASTFLPAFLPSTTLIVDSFAISGTIPTSTSTSGSQYSLSGSFEWDFTFTGGLEIDCTANLALAYDGSPEKSKAPFSGSVLGTISVDAHPNLTLTIGYQFNQPGTDGTDNVLTVQWEGVTGIYDSLANTITLTLNGWSFGSLVTSLVKLTGNPYFSLSGPWAVLNSISLDGLSLIFNLTKGATNTVVATYTLSSALELGFVTINGFQLIYGSSGVTFLIQGDVQQILVESDTSINWSFITASSLSPDGKAPSQATPQDVTNLPSPPGLGNSLFNVKLLALGQHVAIKGITSSTSIPRVIKALEDVPPTSSSTSTPHLPGTVIGYDADSNWLIALDMGLLGTSAGGGKYTYAITAQVVFNDPNLYGLYLAFQGKRAGLLAGMTIQISYQKITPSIGMYQLDFVLPTQLRQLNFGAVNVTLPSIGIQIYTNGDFLFDIGFPYNMDFTNSFTVQAIILGVPVTGSGGFYFGKLSNSTATNLPVTTQGTFDPVIEFGLGLQVGLGYSINKGILQAGFSVTFFGIIQGVIAPWHPYQVSSSGTDVQSHNYFWLKGQFGIHGYLYGTVNFSIITANVTVSFSIAAQIIYESYEPIALSVMASVSVAVSIKINLGLFKVTIHFHFKTTVSENLTIQALPPGTAPWDDSAKAKGSARSLMFAQPLRTLLTPDFAAATAAMSSAASVAAASLPPLSIFLTPQFTVLLPDETQTGLSDQQGAVVALFSMDAPPSNGLNDPTPTSFESLCNQLLSWVLNAYLQTGTGGDMTYDVTQIQNVLNTLADPANQPAIPTSQLLSFLQTGFTSVTISTTPTPDQQQALSNGAVIFPAIPGLLLTVPNQIQIDFDKWTTATSAYQTAAMAEFNQVAAELNNQINSTTPTTNTAATSESIASLVFQDTFAMIARQLLQEAINAYSSYSYAVQPNDSLLSIMTFAQGGDLTNPTNPLFTYNDLVNANANAPLTAKKTLQFRGITYVVQTDNTISEIAAKYTDATGAQQFSTNLITANQIATNLLNAGVMISLNSGSKTVVTAAGDSFEMVAAQLGLANASDLSTNSNINGLTNLLLGGVTINIPTISYTTSSDNRDTFGGLLSQFLITVDDFVNVPANLTVPNIFYQPSSTPAELTLVYLTNLSLLTSAQLQQAIDNSAVIGNTAGMVSRFMMQGLRLPNKDGLSFNQNFLYNKNQSQYGLYQLTGQQFPVTEYSLSTYPVTLSQRDLSWLMLDDVSMDLMAASLGLTAVLPNLQQVLQWATTYGYNPSSNDTSAGVVDPPLTLSIEPALSLTPRQFAAAGFSKWSTSGIAEIAAITGASANGPGQITPILWQLPNSLLSQIETQQGMLEQDMTLEQALPYLPAFTPYTITTDPATMAVKSTEVEEFAFATRIDFQIRNLSQAAGAVAQTAGASTLFPSENSGGFQNIPPVTQLAPYSYQLIGPNASDAQLLDRILQLMSVDASLITGILVSYTNPSSGQSGLNGYLSTDIYSFVTQSNLSTQANPQSSMSATAAAPLAQDGLPALPINDFKNPISGQYGFLQLLWELTTVQSGGYTFYWQGIASGASLPASLFDSTGFATLTLLVTYSSTNTTLGKSVPDCCNALLTTSPIDTTQATLVLQSIPDLNQAKVLPTDSLATLSARYGMTSGTFAVGNAKVTLAAGKQFLISTVFHEVDLYDLAQTDPWTTIVNYYFQYSSSPITASQLQDYNNYSSGSTLSLYTLLMIPTIEYNVQSGDTFASIASYFRLFVEQVGSMAQHVVGLFPDRTPVSVDSQSFSVVSMIGNGNLGMNLTRANLQDPPDLNTDPGFGQDYMFSLYSLLDMSFYGNPDFTASSPSAPFGPIEPPSPPGLGNTASPADMRHPAVRSGALQTQAGLPTLSYTQAISLSGSANKNAAPTVSTGSYLPSANANPYLGVGTIAQLNLRWLDLFGNITSTPFNAPPTNYQGPLNNLPVPILYTDQLIGLSQWPNVNATYQYAGTAGVPVMQVTFTFQALVYQPVEGVASMSAVSDSTTFSTLYYQLSQNYDTLKIPGLSGPAVTISLINTLTNDNVSLNADQLSQLIMFVNKCTALVNAAAASPAVAPAPQDQLLSLSLSLPIDLTQVVTDNTVRLQLMLVLTRNASLVDPDLLEVEGGISVTTEIPAFTDSGSNDPPSNSTMLMTFATGMEAAFVTNEWKYRVGTGPADPDEALANQRYTVWAVRFSLNNSATGLGFTLTNSPSPSFFAPKPVATSLYTGSATLSPYLTGTGLASQPTQMNFTAVDLNVWLTQALAGIDTFLSATYSSPTFIFDQLEPTTFLETILNLKAELADTISGTVISVFVSEDSSTHDPTAAAAAAAAAASEMKQSLLQQLSNATSVTSVVVLPISNASTNALLPDGVSTPPAFYGSPINTPKDTETGTTSTSQNYSLSTASVPLNTSGGNQSSTLAFLFTCANPSKDTSVSLTSVNYQVTHLQSNITKIKGINGYQQCTWIAFVTGPINYPIGQIDFPVPLRTLPLPPTVLAQTGLQTNAEGVPNNVDLAEWLDWNYTFQYGADGIAQDSLLASVKLNSSTTLPQAAVDSTESLFEALANMITYMPAIFKDFDTYLRAVDGTATTTSLNVKPALLAWQTLIQNLSKAYSEWANPQPLNLARMSESSLPVITLDFQVVLENQSSGQLDGPAYVNVIVPPGNPTIQKALIPVIQYDGYTTKPYIPTEPQPSGTIQSYQYVATSDLNVQAQDLQYQAALMMPQTIAVDNLNVLEYQSAFTSIEIQRNLDLQPPAGQTVNPEFVFTTSPVSFPSAVVPFVLFDSFDLTKQLTTTVTSPAPLASYLSEFFTELLGTTGGQLIKTQIQASASYLVNPAVGSTSISLPILLLPPTPYSADTISRLAAAVSAWLAAHQALTGAGATLDFEVILYGTGPSTPPLFKISNVFVAISDLTTQ